MYMKKKCKKDERIEQKPMTNMSNGIASTDTKEVQQQLIFKIDQSDGFKISPTELLELLHILKSFFQVNDPW